MRRCAGERSDLADLPREVLPSMCVAVNCLDGEHVLLAAFGKIDATNPGLALPPKRAVPFIPTAYLPPGVSP
jgi:hypothetical protein